MIVKLEKFFVHHGYALGATLIVSAGIFGFYQNYRPFSPDDLMVLSLAAKPNPAEFFTASLTDFLPMYRPIPYSLIWLQYQFVGSNPVPYYFANILLYIGSSIALYFVVYSLTNSRLSAIVAGLLLLTDIRSASAVYWMGERQTPLAFLFGSLGMLFFLDSHKRGSLQKSRIIIIYLLFLLSALSKEYGLAFAGALVIFSLTTSPKNKRTSFFIAILVVFTYFVMRFIIARSYLNPDYCEYVGYRENTLFICYNDYAFNIRKNFYIWNIGASFIGTFFPKLFTTTGAWIGGNTFSTSGTYPTNAITGIDLLFYLISLGLVAISFYKRPKKSISFLSIIVFVSGLNFLLYRPRNQVIALFGLFTLVGLGIEELWQIVRRRQSCRVVFFITMTFLCFVISQRVFVYSDFLDDVAESYSLLDPCESALTWHDPHVFDMELIEQLKVQYKMSNPMCLPGGWKTWQLKSTSITK